jgi:high-affinity iron transporter
LFAAFVIGGCLGQLPIAAQERFEVTSIKAVRPTIVNTIAALQQRDVMGAREAFDAYDSAWNGIEVYINQRSRELYQLLEHGFQARISKGLEGASPDLAALLSDAQAMLVKFDEAVAMVEKAAPLNPLFDEVARLRIVRAHLREVIPALKVQNFVKARKSYAAFDANWDSIEDLIKTRSADAYVVIESRMIEIERALTPDTPDIAQVSASVNDAMNRYNAVLAEIAKEARGR